MKTKHVVYQVYLPSFQDGNDDGMGDFIGLTNRLDYLASLKVDAIGISPFTLSPMHDNGYDVSDYFKINPLYGTLSDFKLFLNKAHRLNLKVYMDIAFNHTSHQHEGFQLAASDERSKFRKYYFFRPAHDPVVKAQKNLMNVFGSPAGAPTADNKYFYYNTFSKFQPDLNGNNAELRQSLANILRYGKRLGIDGFRLDVFNMVAKNEALFLTQKSVGDHAEQDLALTYGTEVLQFVQDKFIVGECNVPALRAVRYTNNAAPIDSVFSFDHFDERSVKTNRPFSFASFINAYLPKIVAVYGFGGAIALAFNNHDNSRVNSDAVALNLEFANAINILLNGLLLFNPAVSFVYQGDEFGMVNPTFSSPSQLRDIASVDAVAALPTNPKPGEVAKILAISRDNARTPLVWHSSARNGGFSEHKLGLPVQSAGLGALDNSAVRQGFDEQIKLVKSAPQAGGGVIGDFQLTPEFIYYRVGPFQISANLTSENQTFKNDNTEIYRSIKHGADQYRPYELRVHQTEKNQEKYE